jgi:hypothetical protein
MAKKKSKKKHKKIGKAQGQALDQGNIKNVGIMIASVLMLQIVEAAIDRLLQKLPSQTSLPANTETDRQELSYSIESSALTLGNEMGVSPLDVKDLVEAVRATIRDMSPTVDDLATLLKSGAWRTVQQAVGTAGTTTKTAVEEVVSGARTFIDKLKSSEAEVQSKSGKKKRKKKK